MRRILPIGRRSWWLERARGRRRFDAFVNNDDVNLEGRSVARCHDDHALFPGSGAFGSMGHRHRLFFQWRVGA